MQGISGFVLEEKGNQMPMKGAPKKITKGYHGTIYFFEPTKIAETITGSSSYTYIAIHTHQITSVETDSSGHYSVDLPVGKYSIFIKQGLGYYANTYDQFNNIALFEVFPATYTIANLIINNAATY
jgi:hypothetical protein